MSLKSRGYKHNNIKCCHHQYWHYPDLQAIMRLALTIVTSNLGMSFCRSCLKDQQTGEIPVWFDKEGWTNTKPNDSGRDCCQMGCRTVKIATLGKSVHNPSVPKRAPMDTENDGWDRKAGQMANAIIRDLILSCSSGEHKTSGSGCIVSMALDRNWRLSTWGQCNGSDDIQRAFGIRKLKTHAEAACSLPSNDKVDTAKPGLP